MPCKLVCSVSVSVLASKSTCPCACHALNPCRLQHMMGLLKFNYYVNYPTPLSLSLSWRNSHQQHHSQQQHDHQHSCSQATKPLYDPASKAKQSTPRLKNNGQPVQNKKPDTTKRAKRVSSSSKTQASASLQGLGHQGCGQPRGKQSPQPSGHSPGMGLHEEASGLEGHLQHQRPSPATHAVHR